jgi:hypothetical protein
MTELLEAPTSTDQTQSVASEPDREDIERRAYFRYLERGRVDGFDLEDWVAAEAELKDTLQQPRSA